MVRVTFFTQSYSPAMQKVFRQKQCFSINTAETPFPFPLLQSPSLTRLFPSAISTRLWGGAVVVDVGARAFFRRGQDDVKHHLWGEAAFPCRALLLDLTGNATRIFRSAGIRVFIFSLFVLFIIIVFMFFFYNDDNYDNSSDRSDNYLVDIKLMS